MDEWQLAPDIEDQIDAALERARLNPEPDPPAAVSAEYNRALDVIVIKLDTGRRLVIPREDMQGLRDATPEQISEIQIFGGSDICWPQLDLDHNLYWLLKGRYGNDCWMESLEHPAAA